MARAIPPNVEDRAQARIAEEAAENAIRHVVKMAGLSGVVVVAVLAGLLYAFLPSWHGGPKGSQPPAAAGLVETEEAKRLQAKDAAEGQLQQVVTERDAFQGKVAELEKRLAERAPPPPQAAPAAAVSQAAAERKALQAKVGDLERQVAELTQQLAARRAAAVAARSARTPTPARPSSPPVSAASRRTYRCGDGRTVRDPATCDATVPATPAVGPSGPNSYYCGDGRTVTNPADCRPGGALAPRR